MSFDEIIASQLDAIDRESGNGVFGQTDIETTEDEASEEITLCL